MERTLVVLKPDAVERGLVGEIIKRIERVGLKVIAAKMFIATTDLLNKHYPSDRVELITGIGQRTLDGYKELGLDPKKQFGHEDAHKIGLEVQKWLVEFMASGPVFAMVVEGPHAIEVVRKVRGSTSPLHANPGTINGDYSFDSPALANKANRPIRNLVHASGNKEEADFEIGLWFSESELFSNYDTIHLKHMNV
jgi:nucleoside-diphosphate kinase